MQEKRAVGVISIDGVAKLIHEKVKFTCRYEFVGIGASNIPRYKCTYVYEDGREENLVTTRFIKGRVQSRLFSIWPGLFKHHREFGDGSDFVIHADNQISTYRQGSDGAVIPLYGPLADRAKANRRIE